MDAAFDTEVPFQHRLSFVNAVLQHLIKFAPMCAAQFLDMGAHAILGQATRALAFEATLQPRTKHTVTTLVTTMHSAFARVLDVLAVKL
jgi:hypothetical protein